MNPIRTSIAAALLAACCASSFASGSATDFVAGQAGMDAPGPRNEAGAGGRPGPGPERHGARHPGFGPGSGHGFGHGLGQLRRLNLSEAQRDQLFAIGQAAAPQRHQQHQAVRRARQALREAGGSGQLDEARAGAAARELGQAVAAEALLGARLHAQMLAVLTPEQRAQLRQRQPRREQASQPAQPE